MRIAMVSPYDLSVPGGVQAHVRALAAALRTGGDEVALLGPGHRLNLRPTFARTGAGSDAGPEAGADSDAAAGPNAAAGPHAAAGGGPDPDHLDVGPSVAVPFNGSRAPIGLDPRTGLRVRQALRRFAPDLVHVHEPLVPVVGTAAITAEAAPTVATFHAWSDRTRAYRLTRPLGRWVMREVGAAIAVSDAAAAYHGRVLGVDPRRFTVVPNGVDVARFATAEPFADVVADPAPCLLFVGRLERRKGLEPLVRAFTYLKAERPDLILYVVGAGDERARCEALLPAGLREDVRFLGRVDDEDLPRWYASCDLYVSPALGGESFGIVLLEAMAAGRAVVASDLPGYRSVATDGVQARLVSPGDPRALAEAIGGLVDNPAARTVMGREGRRWVQAYDWPQVAGRLREVYEQVLDGR